MKTSKLPYVDLSAHVSQDNRLDTTAETCILQAIIATNNDTKYIAKQLNLNEELVKIIALKYKSQLDRALDISELKSECDQGIKDVVHLYSQHIKEIRENVDANPVTKALSERLCTNLNKMTDRLVTVQENNIKRYDSVINKLSDQVIKLKSLEKLESGEIELSSDYASNVATVVDLINKYRSASEDMVGVYSEKPIRITNLETNEEYIANSLQDAAKYLEMTYNQSARQYISDMLVGRRTNIYKKKYKVVYALDMIGE